MTLALLELWLGAEDDRDHDGRPLLPRLGTPAAQHTASREDDLALFTQISAGDSLAFDTLARRHLATLVRFASALTGDRDSAEDVVQIVLARVWERRGDIAPQGSIIAYLCAAVRHQVLDLRRREGVRSRTAAQAQAQAHAVEPNGTIEQNLADPDDAIVALRAAFFTLPEHYRAALQMRYGQRLGYAEIASALALTPKGAERLLARAVAALRRQVKPLT